MTSTLFWRLLRACTFVLAVGWVLYLTRFGMGVSPDSANYLAGAQSISESFTYRGTDGEPIVYWVPGYSTALSVGSLAWRDPLEVARWLNALLLGLTAIVVWLAVEEATRSRYLGFAASLSIALSVPLSSVSQWVWSELPFCALIAAAFYCCARSDSRRDLLYCTLFLTAAQAVRITGLWFGAAFAFAIFLSDPGPLRKRIVLAGTVLLSASSPLVLFAIRNRLLGLPALGVRGPSGESFTEMLLLALKTMMRWFMPYRLSISGAIPLASALLLLAFTAWAFTKVTDERFRRSLLVACLATCAHMVFSSISTVISAADPPDNRMMAPAYPLLVGWIAALGALPSNGQSMIAGLGRVLICLLLVAVPIGAARDVSHRRGSLGFNDEAWRSSETIRWITAHAIDQPLFATRPGPVWLHAHLMAFEGPRRYFFHAPTTSVDDLKRLDSLVAAGRRPLLVRFRDTGPEIVPLSELEQRYQLNQLFEGSDGRVFQVSRMR